MIQDMQVRNYPKNLLTLEDLPLAQVQVDGFVYKMLKCFMWLLAPLLFILMLDRISNHRLLNRNKELNTINPLINKEEK